MTTASTYSWHNGQIGEREQGAPSVASSSFHLGTGVFDGMMAYWNEDHYYVHRAWEHLERFRRGAARLGLCFPWSVEELLSGIDALLSREPIGTQYVRPIAYRRAPELWVTGAEGRPVDVSIFTIRTESFRDIDVSVRCQISPVERISSHCIPGQVKVSGSYVNSFHARRTAEAAGFNDGIMFDRDGRLAEASAANIFVIDGKRLVTPPLNPDVFPGITRQVLIEIALAKGIEVQERDLDRSDIRRIDGALLCSTLMEVRAVSVLDAMQLRTAELPIYRSLIGAFRAVTHQSSR